MVSSEYSENTRNQLSQGRIRTDYPRNRLLNQKSPEKSDPQMLRFGLTWDYSVSIVCVMLRSDFTLQYKYPSINFSEFHKCCLYSHHFCFAKFS